MKPHPVKTPKIIKTIFPRSVWNIKTEEKEIYLTFDDGPTPEITPWVMKILSKYNAKATFFCIGKNVENHPAIFQKILDEGHSIGNHTCDHLHGWKTNNLKYINNIKRTEEIFRLEIRKRRLQKKEDKIENYTNHLTANNEQLLTGNHGFTTNLFRPPYGKMKPDQARTIHKNGYKLIRWDVLSYDFDQNLKKESCLQGIIQEVEKGSIVVFHDSEKAFKNLQYILPKTLEYFSKKGYVFKAL